MLWDDGAMTGFGRYWVPGPSEVLPEVLQAMVRPMASHRSPEVAALFERLQPGLRAVFGTTRPVYVFASSGTGAVEAGLRAVPRGRVLSLVNGAFSERSAETAAACGHDVDRWERAFGEVHDPAALAARVRGAGYAAITVAHNETSTGALQDLRALVGAAGGVPVLADSVSGAGGAAVDFDDAGLDWVASASQKALAVPPGLGFGVASPRLIEAAARAPGRGLFLDILRYEKAPPPYTPSLPLLYALEAQLERVLREGMPARLARHRAMAERTCAWAEAKGLRVLAAPGARSPTVTCIVVPDGPAVVKALRERGYTVGSGYGALKPTAFRIGHMGEQTEETLEGLLRACDAVL